MIRVADEHKEIREETDKVLDEIYGELRKCEQRALERFRDLAEFKNTLNQIYSRVLDIQLKTKLIDDDDPPTTP